MLFFKVLEAEESKNKASIDFVYSEVRCRFHSVAFSASSHGRGRQKGTNAMYLRRGKDARQKDIESL